MIPSKACRNPNCSQLNPQPLDNFKRRKRYSEGYDSRCRSCTNEAASLWRNKNPEKLSEHYKTAYHKNPDKAKKKARLGRFKSKYWKDLTLKQIDIEWNRLYISQGGRCSICNKEKPLNVEHCHITGKVRSLACNDCNTALARIHENISIAKALIAYIERHNG